MSKIESNSFVVEAKPFNLGRTLAEVDDIVRFQAEQSGLRLYTDHDDVHDADLLGSALYPEKDPCEPVQQRHQVQQARREPSPPACGR